MRLLQYEDTDNALFAKKNAIDTVYLNKHRGVDFSIVGKLKKEIDTFMPDVIQTHLYVVAYVLLAAPLTDKWLPCVPYMRLFCVYQLGILPYCILTTLYLFDFFLIFLYGLIGFANYF